MQPIDWLILTLPVVICCGIAVYTRRYVRGVADFMAGGRHAGRFLISTARSEQGAGAVVFVALFQMFAVAGFTLTWWNQLSVPIGLVVATTGFVVYRYRQTRAMTLAQFFEMRYSRRFRIFTGLLGFFAGLVNFGIIPVIGARFMVVFLGLPQALHVGPMTVPTHLVLMAVFLTACVLMTTSGGQVTVLVTDCAQGMFSQAFYVVVAIALLVLFFRWPDTKAVLLATRPGQSLVNPFDSFGLRDFNLWYVLMAVYVSTYGTMAWQNSHAFNSSAASPHESRMGTILGTWRTFAQTVMVTLLAVCAVTYLHSPRGAEVVRGAMATIGDPATADQMRIPIALCHLLPAGVKGALLSVCLMGIISGDGIHLHSWGSILVQDVIVPLRRTPLSTKTHLRLLRLSIVGVAAWAFAFGAIFPQTRYVTLWWTITMAIFQGGAGAAIIGGLYWARGTTAGAWVGLLVGSVTSVVGIAFQVYSEHVLGRPFAFNGMQISFAATLLAMGSYVVVSLATCRGPHDMDRLLHRGPHAVEPEGPAAPVEAAVRDRRLPWVYRLMGIDGQFTRSDRWVTVGIFAWSMAWVAAFAVGSIAYLIHPWSNGAWAEYWRWTAIYLPLVIGVVTTVWFTVGCFTDLRVFFRRLRAEAVDPTDDGTVAHGTTTDDGAPPPAVAPGGPPPLVAAGALTL